MAIKIYTKTGDKGTTSLLGGTKISKSDIRIEAYGTVDELNSFIGVLRDSISISEEPILHLNIIQNQLFSLGSQLALDLNHPPKFELPTIKESDIEKLEQLIDYMENELPALTNFVIPGGLKSASHAHVCRTVCRRAERKLIVLMQNDDKLSSIFAKYLNRLSDFLFVLSRFLTLKMNGVETLWTSH